MADMWILDKGDQPLAILSTDAEGACNFHSATFREELNQGSSFSFTCDASHDDSRHVTGLNQVLFKDEDGFFRLFKIREIDKSNGAEGPEKIVQCEPAEMELLEAIIEDIRPQDATQQYALDRVLEKTRWTGNVTAQLGLQSTNFYHISAYEAISKIIDTWGGELRFTVSFDEETNKINERVVNIVDRRGVDEGDRFEVGYNVESIHYTEMTYPVSALYGWGGSIETENGGNSRYIDFADVVWSVSAGDPVNKPKGQKWVEFPEAKSKYGLQNSDGSIINTFGQWQDENITDPEELLKKTYEQLVNVASKPEGNYTLDVIPTDKVSLGDTRIAIDRTQVDSIEFQSRIIALEYDISNPDETRKVEMGQFLDVYESDKRIDEIEESLKNINRDTKVTDGSFPDITPPIPKNVTIEGLFSSVSLSWTFDSSSYIAAYEVHGSQVKGFTPSEASVLWKGKEGGWIHDKAGVDNVWYYRIRTVNYHGTASDYTDEFSARTVRIGTNHLEDLSVTNSKIGTLSADKIKVGILNGIAVNAATITGSKMVFEDPNPYNVSYLTASEIYMRRKDREDNTKFSLFQVTEGKVITDGGSITGDSTRITIQSGMLSATSSYDNTELRISSSSDRSGPALEFFKGSKSMGYFGVNANMLAIQSITNKSLYIGTRNLTLTGGALSLTEDLSDGKGTLRVLMGEATKHAQIMTEGILSGLSLYGGKNGGDINLTSDGSGPRFYSNAIYNRTYSNAANVYVTSYGTLGRVTSASKYKVNIKEFPADKYEKVLDLIPKTWYDKNAVESYAEVLATENGEVDEGDKPYITRIPGLIAEDVEAAGLKEFVSYGEADESGKREIEGLMYDRLLTLLIPIVKNLKENVTDIEGRLKNAGI